MKLSLILHSIPLIRQSHFNVHTRTDGSAVKSLKSGEFNFDYV